MTTQSVRQSERGPSPVRISPGGGVGESMAGALETGRPPRGEAAAAADEGGQEVDGRVEGAGEEDFEDSPF